VHAPKVVLFVTRSDPQSRERLGGYLPDGNLVDLQTGHMAMKGGPSPFLRDRTAFTYGLDGALAAAREVLAWVDTERPPGVIVPERNARVVEPINL
jgi:hypothetical protein